MELAVSKNVSANNHFPSSERLFGGETEKNSLCLFIIDCVSWGIVFVCSIKVSVCFSIESNNSFFKHSEFFCC